MRITEGRSVDAAIEALGTQSTFDAALRGLRPRRHAGQPGRLLQPLTNQAAFRTELELGKHDRIVPLEPSPRPPCRRQMASLPDTDQEFGERGLARHAQKSCRNSAAPLEENASS